MRNYKSVCEQIKKNDAKYKRVVKERAEQVNESIFSLRILLMFNNELSRGDEVRNCYINKMSIRDILYNPQEVPISFRQRFFVSISAFFYWLIFCDKCFYTKRN